MSPVIDIASRRGRRPGKRPRRPRATFFFDLADPATYLAAERVERLPAAVTWRPAARAAPPIADRAALAERARTLRLPLVWPDPLRVAVPRAMRAAAHAAEARRGGPFLLAASRLAFCGGFDLEDPEVLAEAAAAAGIALDPVLAAAGDAGRDAAITGAGGLLRAHGAAAMPVLRVGRLLFAGEQRIPEAAAALRTGPDPLRLRTDGVAG